MDPGKPQISLIRGDGGDELKEVKDMAFVLQGYENLIKRTHRFIVDAQSSGPSAPFSDEQCAEISGAYDTFANANEAALKVLTKKASQVTLYGYHVPTHEALKNLESAYDVLAITVIGNCPQDTPKTAISGDASNLKFTLDAAIKRYSIFQI
ncbi:hypothetical protein B0H65DRAFT_446650 [Neurospora tetraspora]|uniref:Uncharacterized protein n=1 Tax=Neurospora tetraspora TaxID=94610 RepID=A0AAE0J1I8_9PEZI|nr:hypothetical protein B0H65DRAFT_446650 [Neurospora tetraspora]